MGRHFRTALLLFTILAGAPLLACGLLDGQRALSPEPTSSIPATARSSPASSTTTAPVTTFTSFEDEQLGLTLRYPEAWSLEQSGDSVTIASEPALLRSDRFDREGAGVHVIVESPDNVDTGSLAQILAESLERLEFFEDGELVEGPSIVTIDGREVAVATIEETDEVSGQTLVYLVTLIRSATRTALVTGVTLEQYAAQFQPTLESVANSVQLTEVTATEIPASQGMVAYGEAVQGAIAQGQGSAWTFIGVEGERIDVTVRPLEEELDVTVDVVDGSGTSILPSGPVDDAFGTETVRGLELPASDQFTVLIQGFAQASGNYELTVAEAGAGSAAQSLAVGESLRGTLEADEQDDYVLRSADGSPVVVVVEPEGELDVVVEIIGPDGGVIIQEDSSYGREQLPFTPDAETNYIVRVRGFAGAAGDYQVTLQSGGVSEAGTSIWISNSLPEDDSEGDDYPFTAAADDVVQAIVQPEGDFDVVVEVWNDDTDQIEETIDESYGREEVTFTATQIGNYYFKILGFEGQEGAYSINLIGPPTTLFELAIGDQVEGQMDEAALIQYTLRINPSDEILIRVTPDADTDVVVELSDLEDNVLAEVDDGFSGEAEELPYQAPADTGDGEIHFLRVSDFSGEAGGTYSMTITED
jgi:hypothetical protein